MDPQAHILILEDEPAMAEALKIQVEQLGYEVVCVAETGEQAITFIQDQLPDLALIDIVLPGDLDGIEVAEHFKKAGVPVVFLTAHADEALLERAKVTEPYGYILKPSSSRELQANLAMALFKAESEHKLAERNRLYATLFSFCDAVMGADRKGRIVLANEALVSMLKQTRHDIMGCQVEDVLALGDKQTGQLVTHEIIYKLEKSPLVRHDNLSLMLKNGDCIDVSVGASRVLTEDGERLGYALLIQDMTERNKMLTELNKLSAAAEQTADAVMITDTSGVIEYVNKSFETTTGYARDEVLAKTPSILRSGYHGAPFYERLWDSLSRGVPFREVFINRKKDGSVFYEDKTITPLRNLGGEIMHFLSVGSDITSRLQTEERLQYLVTHDVQTDLPNRALFQDRLSQALLNSQRSGRFVAVLFLGIDRMRVINETLGHAAGDACLKQIALRMEANIRPSDTVARFGGDEFVVLLDNLAIASDAIPIVQKLLKQVASPLQFEGQELVLTASAGVGIAPTDANDFENLIRCAEAAMGNAKRGGTNRYQFFTQDMNSRAFEMLNMEVALRHAMERNEFLLHYQPIFSLADQSLVGFEALLRWQRPSFGLVQPDDFIPLLEATGLIVPVGLWVLQESCRQWKEWASRFDTPVTIAVNLSPLQFSHDQLVEDVAQTIRATGIPPGQLYLEVTESMVMHDVEKGAATMHAIEKLGVSFAIDDFGTGYSSLSYLTRLPVNTLKVDRAFLKNVPADVNNSKVTQSIIALGQSLGLRIIAEGVETETQAQFLQEQRCGLVQGFLFGAPQPATGCDVYFNQTTSSA